MLNWLRRLFSQRSSHSSQSGVSIFTPDAFKDLDKWSLENWMKVPEEDREACIRCIHMNVSEDVLREWKDQYENGLSIGGEFFHFGGGMSVRNLLRSVIADSDLPGVFYPDHNDTMYNWDDYYMGALQEAMEKYPS